MKPGLRFDALGALQRDSPPADLERFRARDGSSLGVRSYVVDTDAPVALILVHGSGSESRYLAGLAHALSGGGEVAVYTPDLRGHGPSPARRGDIDYVEQLEDDLADLAGWVQERRSQTSLVVGGHSSGGGLALRFAGGPHADLADGILLLAPFLAPRAPTTRKHSGGWAEPKIARIIAISVLNGFGIHAFDATTVLEFNMPIEVRDGCETLAYSFRMMTGFAPRDFAKDLERVATPLLVLVGSEDEAFYPERFEPTIRPHAPHAQIQLVRGASHLSLPSDRGCAEILKGWLPRCSSEHTSLPAESR